MFDKEKTVIVNTINQYDSLKKKDNEYYDEDELSSIDYKNEFKNKRLFPFLKYEADEKKNLTFLKDQKNPNLIMGINKRNSYLNLYDKQSEKNKEKNYLPPTNSNNKTENSYEEKSSEKIIKRKNIFPDKRKNSDLDVFDRDTIIEYTKLKKDLFADLTSSIENKNNNNNRGRKNELKESIKNLKNSTGFEITKMIKDYKKEKLKNIYDSYINFANKKNYFISFFIIGIVISLINLIISIILLFYGNIEIYSLFILLNIFLILIYSSGIYFIHKNYKYTFKIVSLFQAPEKIEYHKNGIYLIIYFLLISFGYFFILIIGNTLYKNNVKIDIRGKGYDKNKWKYSFQNKTFKQVIKQFDIINIVFNSFCWISLILILIILIFFISFFRSYQFWKRILQVICIFFGQISFILINISSYCLQFRNITLLDEHRLLWVTAGLILVGMIGTIMSIYGFYLIYSEKKMHFKIFTYLCLLFFVGSVFFAIGAKALGLKFKDFKEVNCNNLFKFISEDYLLYNNDCSSKYLFSQNSLDNIICPKERIMINWELTEKNDNKNNIIYGCINQSCCMRIYFKLKSGFNYQEIIAIHLIFLYIILFIGGKYMQYKVDKNFDEEIIEKINFLIIFSLTIIIYIICIVIMSFRPKTSSQSILNTIKIDKNYKDQTVINKEWFDLTHEKILKSKSDELYNELIFNNYFTEAYNIINDYNNSIFNFEYYEYYLTYQYIDIDKNTQYNYDNNYFYDFNIKSFQNGTKLFNFKSKNNIINSVPKYFKFSSNTPFLFKDSILISVNIIYSINMDNIDINKEKESIDFGIDINKNVNNITITKDLILLNYNNTMNISKVNILYNKKINLINNISDKDNIISFYLKGNIYDDEGSSIINIYNYYIKDEIIYSEYTDNNGYFSIGPFFIYKNNIYSFQLGLEIFKVEKNITKNKNLINADKNYNNFSSIISIGDYSFNPYYPFPLMNNILLPKIINKKFEINGYVFNNIENEPIGEVYIKLYKGNKIIKINEELDDKNYLSQTMTSKDGKYNINIESNGQYTLVYMKQDFYMEAQNVIINDTNIEVKSIGLIQLFNSGKIIVKLEWGKNPPDLDLYCRFEINNNLNNNNPNYCYTFFGNQKCVESNYPIDNKRGGNKGSEIIEINTVSDYIYFFYVKKYYDISNNKAQNEYKINDIEDDLNLNSDINNNILKFYKDNDELIKNSYAKLSLYANGIKIPINIVNIRNEDINENKFNYWAGFCINGKEGLKSLKIINKFYKNEPPKNICIS